MALTAFAGGKAAYTAHEAINEVPELTQDAGEASATAEHFGDVYEHFADSIDEVTLEVEPTTGTVTATLPKDKALSLRPLEQAFSRADDTERDIHDLKWPTIGAAVGLLGTAAALRLGNKSEHGTGRKLRTAVGEASRESLGSLIVLTAAMGGFTGVMGEHLVKPDIKELSEFDSQRAFELSDRIEAEVKELNIEVTQGEETTSISFQPKEEAIAAIRDSSAELSAMMPNITNKDIEEAELLLPFAAATLFGFAGTLAGAGSAVAEISGNRQARRGAERQRRPRQQRAEVQLAGLMTGNVHRRSGR
ncbi:MAG TPA: hypothetical protein VK674_06890 [Candidatus Limnocylindria bacterium]|nr:hypothetical protein [Candidatus Limnocylindria bacterium]